MAPQVKTIAAEGGFTSEGFGDGLKSIAFLACLQIEMSTNYLALRSSAAPTFTVSTLLAKSISLQSTTITLGQSTNQTNNFSSGSFTTGWASTLTGLTSIKKVVLSPNGSVQTILQNSGSTMSTTITSLNSGSTWAGSTMRGLPTSGALPYQTYGSTINAMAVPSITAITAAPSGTNQLAIASNDLVYSSANSGATFSPTGLGQNNSPFIYIPFDGSSVADVMGNSAVTATGSMAYVTGKVGTNAVNLVNTAGGTANNYLRGSWAGFNAFTVSFWFNAQTLSGYANLFITANATISVFINAGNNVLMLYVGGTSINGPVVSTNTWYNVTAVYQNGGTSSLYVNNAFYASGTGSWNAANITGYGIGAQEIFTAQAAFNGYIDDFRLYNYAVTNPSGAALINPIVGPIMPFVYVTFDGSTTTDLMGNSTTTATGSPGFVVGQVGSNAMNLVNPPGGTPVNFIRGTIAATTLFTVSGWVNFQTVPTSGNSANMAFSIGSNSQTFFYLQYTNGVGLQFQFLNSSSATITVGTQASISTNTWYNFVIIYSQTGTCQFYLNSTLIGSVAGVALLNTITTYSIGSQCHAAASAFNGYIDDLRIYNGAFTPSQLSPMLYSPSFAVGSPNIYLPFENGSVLDTMGYSAVSARGTMNFVPGVVGSTALNLVNPAGGTAVNYVRGSWAGSPNFTVSFWFNLQALGVIYQNMFTSYSSQWAIDISSDRLELWYGGSRIVSSTLSLNTWYYTVGTFVANGTGELYLNGTRVGTYSCGATAGTSSGLFGLGTNDVNTANAGNIYIDDLKIYNCAVPFHALGPMNYTQAAISNTGAYQVVAAANGGVYTSANSGSSWSQVGSSALAVISEVDTVGGQVITPNLASLAANTWTQNGVNWVASASTVYQNAAYFLFNTVADNWASALTTYNGTGGYANSLTTVTQNAGTISGEWFQIQSSVPLVASSYSYIPFNMACTAKTYFILGSNDGTTWYAIQSASYGATNPCTNGSTQTSVIIMNSSSVQTVTAGATGLLTTVAYSTTTNAYTYFRLVGTSIWTSPPATFLQYGEFYFNFATPPTPLYVAPSTALIANQSVSAITVMPQQTGLIGNTTSSTLVTTTWTTNGISWTASASSVNSAGFQPWVAFNNLAALSGVVPYSWATPTMYNTSGTYTGSVTTTVLGGIGAVTGEWLQIQSSVPLVMSSYTYAVADYRHTPKTGYIVGSNDGTTWYPIQNISMTTNPLTTNWTSFANYIVVNQTGIQTIQGGQTGSGTFTPYPTSTNAYTYFRVIGSSVWPNQYGNLEFTEWFINFTAYTPSLLQSLTMSPTGAHMALTGAGATAPNLTGLTGATGSSGIVTSWTANGVTWTSSASNNTNAAPAWQLFNNAPLNTWVPTSATYTTAGNTSGVNNTFFTNGASTLTVQGDWAQLQSSSPLIMASYGFGCGFANTRFPKTYYIIGSNDAVTWYAIQSGVGAAAPTVSANYSLIGGTLLVNLNSAQAFGGSTITTITYSATTLPFLYFRLVITNSYSSSADVLEIAEWYINFQSGPTFYSTDYGSSWTRALSAATLPNANVLATSGGGQYSLQASGQAVTVVSNTFAGYSTGTYTTPTFSPALTFPVSNAALSATGEYMVILIQSTTNNVYYSTNYGVSFTGITLGSAAMVSCDISADGSYITVSSATQVFTLNRNAQGFSITVGNQSGLINQGLNAVAIGNQAGQINQSANSIILNASTAAVNSYVPGFFVAPVASAGSSISGSFAVLGYGTDSQVVQTGMTVLSNGTVGIGTTAPGTGFSSAIPNAKLTILNGVAGRENGKSRISIGGDASHYAAIEAEHIGSGATTLSFMTSTSAFTNSGNPETRMFIANTGNVGIGVTNPINKLHVHGGIITASGFTDITKPERTMIMYYANAVDAGVLEAYNYTVGTRYPVLINPNGGNVGIGTNAPLYQFQVVSGVPAYVGSSVPATTIGSFVRNMTYLTTDRVDIEVGSSSTAIGDIGCTYKYRLGMAGTGATPGANFQISGVAISGSYFGADIVSSRFTITPNGTIIFNAYNTTGTLSILNTAGQVGQASDRRIKENIVYQTDTQQGLTSILHLKPATFNFIGSSDSHLGFIAQDVEQDIPLAVDGKKYEWQWEVTEDGKPKFDANGDIIYKLDENGDKIIRPRGLTDRAIIATQTLAIQELSKQNIALTQKLDSLLAWAQTQGFS